MCRSCSPTRLISVPAPAMRRRSSAACCWNAATATNSVPAGAFGTGFTSNDWALPSRRTPLADTTISSAE